MSNNNDNYNNNTEDELHEVGSNRPACASCKHQRKKCIEGDCAMWRHFPANKMDEFLSVHKAFGISNVTKKIKSLDDVAQQDEAIKSFLWEARLWQEDPVHGPLGEYRKLEQQLKEEQRNKQLQIAPLQDAAQLPTTTTSQTSMYLPPLAVDQSMVAPRENSENNSMHTYNQQYYNILNSSVPNYTNPLPQHGYGGETQGTTGNGQNLINVGTGGNNEFGYGNFPSHYNTPIQQVPNAFIPRQPGVQGGINHPVTYNDVAHNVQGSIHHPATYNNVNHNAQLHQQRYPYNNKDLGQGRRRKEQSDQIVNPSFNGRHVRGRGIRPSSTTAGSLAAPPIYGHGPMISSNSSGPFVDSNAANAMTMVRPSVDGRHVEVGRNQRAEVLAAVPQDFTNYNHINLPGEHKQPDLENRDDPNSRRF